MKNYEINGILGIESTYAAFSSFVNSANGDDLHIVINTPGGDVNAGFAMISAMRAYKTKYPNAKITMEARGMLASMGPVVFSSAPVDHRIAEDNVAGMVHNPWMFAQGDSREMRKVAGLLDAYTENYASSLAMCNKKKSKAQIQAMMNDETWMFGRALLDNGFCDEIVPAGDGAENEVSAMALARTEVARAEKVVKSAEQAAEPAAVAVAEAFISMSNTSGVPGEKDIPESKGGKKVNTLAELKNDAPSVYAEASQSFAKVERERIVALLDMKKKYGEKVGAAAELCDKAINEGKSAADISGEVLALVVAALESPPAINTGANGTASGEQAPQGNAPAAPANGFRTISIIQ